MSDLHPDRPGLVTGSRCSVLFPQKGDGKAGMRTYAKQLAMEKFFGFADEVSTWQMDHGKMAEHFAFLHYQRYVSDRIEKGGWHRDGDCGGSTDAELPNTVVDFKCPTTMKEWLAYLHDGIDKSQEDQLQMYCYLTSKPYGEIAAYLTETQKMTDNGITYPVKDEQRMIRIKIEASPEWQAKLVERVPIVIAMRDEFIEQLNQYFK